MTIDEARVLVALHGGTAGECAKDLLTRAEIATFDQSWSEDGIQNPKSWDNVRRDRVARIIADRKEQL